MNIVEKIDKHLNENINMFPEAYPHTPGLQSSLKEVNKLLKELVQSVRDTKQNMKKYKDDPTIIENTAYNLYVMKQELKGLVSRYKE